MPLASSKFYNLNYKTAFFYLKSTGISMIVVSGCWLLYQVRKTSTLLDSVVSTKILDQSHSKAQYIYVEDPKFKDFSFENFSNLSLSVEEKPKTLTDKVSKWWRTLNRRFTLNLLSLAKDGTSFERQRAVNMLNSLQYLKDWHYCQIAQILDARTAVSLARLPDSDLRFFLQPPLFNVEYRLYEIIEKLYELLKNLNNFCEKCHPCLLKFLQAKFQNSFKDTSIFEHDISSGGMTVPTPKVWDQDFLLSCVQAVHHHSSLEEHSKDVVTAGGLRIMMNVYKYASNNIDICVLLAKILSNLSLHPEYLEEIFMSGWIGVLAKWSRSEDIRLAAPASRVLANLDSDDTSNVKYPPRIYPLYPLYKVPGKQKLDVIFIHGLLGGVFVTWRQRDSKTVMPKPPIDVEIARNDLNLSSIVDDNSTEFLKDLSQDLQYLDWQRIGKDFEFVLEDCPINVSQDLQGPFTCKGDDRASRQLHKDCRSKSLCWPKDWLPEDVPYLRIIGLNYDTNLSMWTPQCPITGVRSNIKERSSEFSKKLVIAGVGKRSIIWACHSMGGLLVKKMLVDEWKSGDKNGLLKNTKGIIFYSTPHRGSHVASLKQTTQMLLWPSVEVQELRERSDHLLQLHEDFLQMLKEHDIEVVSFGETKSTPVTALKFPLKFVDLNSADPQVGEFFEIPQDHFSICKPANRQSFLYQKMLTMIRKHVEPYEKKDDLWTNFLSVVNKLL